MKSLAKDILFGVAVADALGAPLEFVKPYQIDIEQVQSNYITISNRETGIGTWDKPVGTFTDDTSMTLCTAEYLVQDFEDLNLLMKLFLDWSIDGKWTADGDCFDIGSTVQESLINFQNSGDYRTSGLSRNENNGNGSLMRILPVLFKVKDLDSDKDFELITESFSSITHSHPISINCCYIYLKLAKELLVSDNIDLAFGNLVRDLEDRFSNIGVFQRLFSKNFLDTDRELFDADGYVLGTLEICVYCLLTTNSYKDAVVKAISFGGDTDTNAAVCGGLAGIFYGYDSIPRQWILDLKRRDDIEKLAMELESKFSNSIQ